MERVSAAEDDPVPGLVDVLGEDDVPVVPDGHDGRLVDQVGQVGPGEPRGGPGHGVEVDVGGQVLAPGVHGQDGGPLGLVGQGDLHLAVEAARAQEGRVEHLGAVGGGHDHHPGGGVEAVHLGQQLVEGLLPLVVGDESRAPPALADGVDLVDEDDRRGPLAGVGEQVPDPRGAHPDEQLDEARAGEGEEGHSRLSGHRPGHERLAGARRAHHEHPPGADGPGSGVALGMTQEVDHLGDLTLGPFVAGDVGEAGGGPVLVVDLGLGPADAHDPPGQLLRAPPPDPDEEGDEQQEGEEGQQVGQQGRALSHPGDVHVVGLEGGGQLVVGDGGGDLAGVVVPAFERRR